MNRLDLRHTIIINRPARVAALSGFGATGATGASCPAPGASGWSPITGHTAASLAWCDCMYPPAVLPSENKKCRVNPSWSNPGAAAAPWTTYGKDARGLPDDSALANLLKMGSATVKGVTTPSAQPAPPPTSSSYTTHGNPVGSGLPSIIDPGSVTQSSNGALIFGGLLLLGGLALAIGKRSRK